MTDLSPAAASIVQAFNDRYERPLEEHNWKEACLADALRAAADQVAPFPGRYPMNEYMEGLRDARQNVRRELLALAAELDAQ